MEKTKQIVPEVSKISRMKIQAKKLVTLLDEKETGWFTWHIAVHETIEKINKIYEGK